MSCKNSDRPLGGVKCVVENCVHHNTDNECMAEHIMVGGKSASNVSETGCETFSKRECCN
ncbi:MAG: DUF1540 domain-containing protein [Clostridia bacterium]|nr:DUF1540 domain-containing protein [Clostridia bacterium]